MSDAEHFQNRCKCEASWRRGILGWKLRPIQEKIKDEILTHTSRKSVIHCSRRIGKSYLLVILALEYAMRAPRWPVRYVAPTRVGLRQIIHPLFRDICADCPPPLRPVWSTTDNQYVLPTEESSMLAASTTGIKMTREAQRRACAWLMKPGLLMILAMSSETFSYLKRSIPGDGCFSPPVLPGAQLTILLNVSRRPK